MKDSWIRAVWIAVVGTVVGGLTLAYLKDKPWSWYGDLIKSTGGWFVGDSHLTHWGLLAVCAFAMLAAAAWGFIRGVEAGSRAPGTPAPKLSKHALNGLRYIAKHDGLPVSIYDMQEELHLGNLRRDHVIDVLNAARLIYPVIDANRRMEVGVPLTHYIRLTSEGRDYCARRGMLPDTSPRLSEGRDNR